MHKESTLDDLYGDVESQNDNSCASDESWNISKHGEIDVKNIVFDNAVNNDEIDDLDIEDVLHLNDGLENNNNNNNIKHIKVINQQDKQQIILVFPIIIYNQRMIIFEDWVNLIQMAMMRVKIITSMSTYQMMMGQILTITVTTIIQMIANSMTLNLRLTLTVNLKITILMTIVNLVQMR